MKYVKDKTLQNRQNFIINTLKETCVDLLKGLVLGGCFVFLILLVATCSSSVYPSDDLKAEQERLAAKISTRVESSQRRG